MPANYVLLGSQTVGNGGATSVTLDNIPQSGYTDLKVVISGRDTSTAGTSGNGYSFTILPNGLNTNITQRSLFGGSPVGVGSYTDTQMYNVAQMGADTASTFSNIEIYIPNYRSSNAKSFSIDGVTETNGAQSAIRVSAGLWNSSSAITKLQFNAYSTWAEGSTFYIYGVAEVGTTPVLAPFASGGDVIANDGTYWYHAFKSTGAFVPAKALNADILLVAGGGGGNGGGSGGGGGAGGIFYATSQALSTTSYTCTVGAGGNNETNGTNSVFGSLTPAVGGGGGGGANPGQSGGSGAGGYPSFAGGSSTQTSVGGTGYGNSGGAGGAFTSPFSSGGGGGAGAAGTAGNSAASQSGAGGAGLNTWSSWASATATGVSGYFAGGGGGGANQQYGGTSGAGGAGGGGAGGNPPVAGTANTGGGGGGSATQPNGAGTGGKGGSGIVIIRYAMV